MPNILIRDVTEAQAAKLDSLAQAAGKSRQAYLAGIIDDIVGDYDPQVILGYIEVTGGELGPEDTCPECGQDYGTGGIWLGFKANLKPFGPVCYICSH